MLENVGLGKFRFGFVRSGKAR